MSNMVNARFDNDDDSEPIFDYHREAGILGHTGKVTGEADHDIPAVTDGHRLRVGNETVVIIAIGAGITSRGVKGVDASSDFVAKFQFFNTFLPTFCKTAGANFNYRFYLAHNHVDPVFANQETAALFHRTFAAQTKKICLGPRGIRTSLRLVQCSHRGKPAWAQNDAMLEAYIDHVDYRINDETRYIAAVRARDVSGVLSTSSDGRRVIAMTLFGRDPRHTWGVLRNAQLVPVFFPGWRLRVYIPSNNVGFSEMVVPPRFINKLRLLGADVVRVGGRIGNSSTYTGYRWQDWRLLVADDQSVDFFLIRDSESRLNDRDAFAVNEWIAEVERSKAAGDVDAFPVHCIRDHLKHADGAVVDGLWGGRPAVIRRRLGSRLATALYRKSPTSTVVSNETGSGVKNASQLLQPKSTLEEVLWPIVVGDKATGLSLNVVSACDRWTGTTAKSKRLPFPVARLGNEYVGQKYDEHQEIAVDEDSGKLGRDVICSSTISPH